MTRISMHPTDRSEIFKRRNDMTQAAQAIAADATVTIDATGGVDHKTVKIPVGGIVQFTSSTNTPWEIAYYRDDSDDYYSLTLFVPSNGSAYIVGDTPYGGDTCEYAVHAVCSKPHPYFPGEGILGNNQIIVGSGLARKSKSRKSGLTGKSKRGASRLKGKSKPHR
jgi:hypothetical protein